MSRATLLLALRRVTPLFFLGVIPLIVTAYTIWAVVTSHTIAADFRAELYPEAQLVLHGINPFPTPDADLSGGLNLIYPIPAALLVAPLTVFPVQVASAIYMLLMIVLLGATLYVLEIRDWRVYGAVALWPATVSAVETGNLTILLALCCAFAWRHRDRTFAGVPIGIGIALKLYLWPLAIWLVAVRKPVAAAVACALAAVGVLMTLPFTSLNDYAELMANLGRTFAPYSATPQGLLLQLGASTEAARLVTYAVGGLILLVAYRRRSLGLFVAAGLALSPIVWLHYFVLFVIPLGLSRKTFSPLWLVPLALWIDPGNFDTVHAWNIALALVTAAVVFIGAERRPASVEREARPELTPVPA